MAYNNDMQKLQICLVSISLGKGGAERSTALLSTMLTQVGFDVTIVILNNRIDYPYSGELFNLGLFKKEPDNSIARLLRFRKLRKFIKSKRFDLIIDNRTKPLWKKEKFYLNYLYSDQKLIYVVRSFKRENYLSDKNSMTLEMIRRTEQIITVSEESAASLNKEYNTNTFYPIHNPIEELPIKRPKNWDISQPYILFMGRMDTYVKNLPLLLDSYYHSKLPSLGVPLLLLGEGSGEEFIANRAKELGIEDMIIQHPYTANVGWYLKNAEFLVLSSRYEGFPRVLIEALSVGTPVVSVDCSSGPKEIVQHGINGLLVPNHDISKLSTAITRMYMDKTLYNNCKTNAKNSVNHLHMNVIAERWKNVILKIVNK